MRLLLTKVLIRAYTLAIVVFEVKTRMRSMSCLIVRGMLASWDSAIVQLRHEYEHIFVNNRSDDLISFVHQHHVDAYKFISKLVNLFDS